MNREEIIRINPIAEAVRKRGVDLKQSAGRLVALCPLHKENTPSFTVDEKQGLFKCFGCDAGGSVIDFVAKMDGITIGEAMRKLTPEQYREGYVPAPTGKPTIEAVYEYQDETGKPLYEALRLKPKSFRQRHRDATGNWVWNMEGVRRVLYRLPKVLKSKMVWIVEGEKDADNLSTLGIVATCNVGGAGKWMDGYTECLKGKEVVLCGDNDAPGQKHVQLVLESIAGKVKTVRVVKVPVEFKDISDYLDSIGAVSNEDKVHKLGALWEAATVLRAGLSLPIKTMADLEAEYRESIKEAKTSILNLGHWLPSLGRRVRGIVPGELITVLADTGVGKTMILQNIGLHARPIETLLFEMELPGSLTFERFVAMSNQVKASDVYDIYEDPTKRLDWDSRLSHIHVCTESKLSPADIERLIIKSELVIGTLPRLVLIDYFQLAQGLGKTRYEKMSNVAEDLKIVAKSTKTVLIVASQIKRDEGREEVSIHDAKDSGSIENSSGLVLGAWRTKRSEMKIKILKNTKGAAGFEILCNVDGETMRITEQCKISSEDVP